MAPSNSLLDNRLFNNLVVNRLSAQKIRSDNVESLTPSYLFSGIFTNSNFTPIGNNGTLVIDKSTNPSIIRFSDRPFRQSKRISLDDFIQLFSPDESGSNTFNEDPPNAVLSHNDEQQTFIITSISDDNVNGTVTFNLSLLPNETHIFPQLNNTTLDLFVDSYTLSASGSLVDSTGTKVDSMNVDCLKITTQSAFGYLINNPNGYFDIKLIILDGSNFSYNGSGAYNISQYSNVFITRNTTLMIEKNTTLINIGTTIYNEGTIINKGIIVNNMTDYGIPGVIINNNTIKNEGTINNNTNGSIINNNTIHNHGGTINNNKSVLMGTITLNGGNIEGNGVIINYYGQGIEDNPRVKVKNNQIISF